MKNLMGILFLSFFLIQNAFSWEQFFCTNKQTNSQIHLSTINGSMDKLSISGSLFHLDEETKKTTKHSLSLIGNTVSKNWFSASFANDKKRISFHVPYEQQNEFDLFVVVYNQDGTESNFSSHFNQCQTK